MPQPAPATPNDGIPNLPKISTKLQNKANDTDRAVTPPHPCPITSSVNATIRKVGNNPHVIAC